MCEDREGVGVGGRMGKQDGEGVGKGGRMGRLSKGFDGTMEKFTADLKLPHIFKMNNAIMSSNY